MKLGTSHERWIHMVLAAVYFTGVAWLLLRYGVRDDGLESGWSVARAWLLRAHGAAAMLTLVTIGSLLAIHVPSGWRLGTNLRSGIGMLATMAGLALTGWLLYYASGESLRAWSSWVHIVIGAAAPLFLLWHLAYRQRSAKVKAWISASKENAR
ncbi:MAG TPA: DUF4405 domain-containing protein [Burkholderiales bacterium]|jgi:hypothetical protein|nr:DUF4405 domain-containing protein [Burkholderiales bacterium]